MQIAMVWLTERMQKASPIHLLSNDAGAQPPIALDDVCLRIGSHHTSCSRAQIPHGFI